MKKQKRMLFVAIALLLVGAVLFAQGEKAAGPTSAEAAANLEASLKVDSSVLKPILANPRRGSGNRRRPSRTGAGEERDGMDHRGCSDGGAVGKGVFHHASRHL